MNLWYFLLFCGILTSFSHIVKTQNTGNCQFDDDDVFGDNGNYVNTAIDDTAISQTIKTWTFQGNLNPSCIANCDFFDAKVDQNNLIISTTSNFANLDLNTAPQSNSIVNIAPSFKFTCDGDSILVFVQPVKDTNGYPPTFGQDTYEYTVPLPLMPNYQITSFKDRIIVTDIDFSNTDVTFKIDGSDKFEINRISGDAKQYEAQLTVKEPTWFEGDITITATDTGTPSRSSTATIKIIADPDSSLPEVPTFSEAYYVYDYTEEDGNPQLNLKGNPILVTSQTEPKVTLSSGSLPDTFTVDYDRLTNIVTIGVNKKIENPSSHTLVLTLTATIEIGTKSESTNVGVLINIPDELVTIVPKFSSNFYSAAYIPATGLDTITVSEDIIVTPSENIQVTFKDGNDYFQIAKIDDKWQLDVMLDIPDAIIKQGKDIILTLVASIDGQVEQGYSIVVVTLPKVVGPQFTQSIFMGSYTKDNQVGLDIPIAVDTDDETLQVILENYNDNFELLYNEQPQIKVVKSLDDSILESNTEIVLSIKAIVDDIQQANYATVVLKLPEVIQPQFTKPMYNLEYQIVDGAIDTVDLKGEIITTTKGQATIQIINGDVYEQYFTISYDDGSSQNTVIVSKDLEDSVLEENTEIFVGIEAIIDSRVSQSVLRITLPTTTTDLPTFTQTDYVGNYIQNDNQDQPDTVEIEGNGIALINNLPNSVVEISENYGDSFQIQQQNDKYLISVKTNLETDIVETEPVIVLRLETKILGGSNSNFASVVIKLPKKSPPPSFSQSYYTANYKINSDQSGLDTIEITNGPIKITASSTVTVTLQDLDQYFEIVDNGDNTYDIKLKQNLDETITEKGQDVVVVIEATASGVKAVTALVIVLPLTMKETTPIFSNVLYSAQYTVLDDIHDIVLAETITVKNYPNGEAQIQIIGDYSTNFLVTFDGTEKIYKLTVNEHLSDDVLNNNVEIILTLQAFVNDANDFGYANIVVSLPVKSADIVPKFSASYYSAVYSTVDVELDTITLTNLIEIISEESQETKVEVIDDYKDNFEAVFQNANWQLRVIKDLDEDFIGRHPEIIITLKASLNISPHTSTSFVVATLPSDTLTAAPRFSHTYYTAEYQNDEITISGDSIEILDKEDQVLVTLSGDYSDNFKLTHDTTNKQWNIEVVSPLDPSVLTSEKQLVLELTATLTGAAESSATLLIKLPEIAPVTFDKSFYEATYIFASGDNNDLINLPDDIIVSNEDAIVAIDAANDVYFKIDCLSGKCTLTIEQDLPQNILDDNIELILSLEASIPGQTNAPTASATVIVDLPQKYKPVLTQSAYIASYIQDETALDSINLENGPIAVLNQNVKDFDINIISGPSNFEFAPSGDESNWVLNVVQDLSEDDLQESTITINFEIVSHIDSSKGTGLVIIKLPKKTVTNPFYFSDVLYVADYNEDTNTIILDNDIMIEGHSLDQLEVELTGDSSGYFDSSYDKVSGKVTITVKNIPTETLENEVAIPFNVQATLTDVKVSAGVVVKLPKIAASPFRFSNTLYIANFDENSNTIIIDEDVLIEGSSLDQLTVELTGDSSGYFDSSYDKVSGKVTITVKNIPTETLENEAAISFNVQATLTDVKVSAGVVVKLPKIAASPFRFSNILYIANFDENSNTIIIDEDVLIEGSSLDQLTVELTGDSSGYFDSSYDKVSGKVTITVKNIPTETLENEAAISFNVQATLTDVKVSAGVVVKLPKIAASPFRFSNILYIANFDENSNTIIIGEDVLIEGSSLDQLTVELTGDSSGYFDSSYDKVSGKVTITVKNIPTETLENEAAISFNVQATLTDVKVSAGVVVKLPKIAASPFRFSNTLYIANFDENSNTIIIDEDVLIEGSSLDQLTVELTGDSSGYFDSSYDKVSGKVTITVKNIPTETLENEAAISFNVQATLTDVKVSAGVVVKLPKIAASPFRFSNTLYIANFDEDSNSIILDEDVLIEGSSLDQLTVELTGDSSGYFDSSYDKVSGKVTITVKNIPTETLENEAAISFNVQATLTDVKVSAGVVVKLPKIAASPFRFSNTLYIANFDEDSNSIILDEDVLIEGSSLDQLTVQLTGDSSGYFDSSYDKVSGKVTITVKNIPTETLENEAAISFNVEATLTDVKVSSGVVVKLPKIAASPFRFSNTLYTAKFDEDSNTIILDEDVLIEGSSLDQLTIELTGDSSGYFDFSYDKVSGKVSITVKNIPTETLENESAISFSVQATLIDVKVSAGVVVKLSKIAASPFRFSNTHYIANFDEDSNTIILDEDVLIEGSSLDQLTVQLTGDSSGYFDSLYDKVSGKVTITVKNIPIDILENEAAISFNVQATLTDVKVSAGVVVKLPKIAASPFRFSNTLYIANFDEDSNTIILDEEILVEGSSLDQLTVELTGDSSGYFDSSYDKVSGKVTITVKNIPTETLENEAAISFNVQATLTDVKVSSGIVVKLPKIAASPFRFSNTLYIANFDEDSNTIILDEDVLIEGSSLDQLTVELTGDSSGYFDSLYDKVSGKVTITVKNIPIDTLENEAAISFNVQATLTDVKVSAGVVVKLPKKTVTSPFYFSDVLFVGEYKEDTNTIDLTKDIVIQGNSLDQLDVELIGDSSDYFDVSYDKVSGKVTITVKNIPTETLENESAISFSVQATLLTVKISAGVVVKLSKIAASPFHFSDTLYIANFDEDSNSIILDEDILVEGSLLDQLTVELTGAFKDYFDVSYDKSSGKLLFTVKQIPDDILAQESAISVGIKAFFNEIVVSVNVMIKLPKQTSDPNAITFNNLVFNAEYKLEDDMPEIDLDDDIRLSGQSMQAAIITLTDYTEYFTTNNDNGDIQISIIKKLPNSVIEKGSLSFKLEALVELTGASTEAGVIVKLPATSSGDGGSGNSSDPTDLTPYIVVISLLGVLLVGFLIASAAFYYYRQKRSNKYTNMDEDVATSENRFTRNPKASDLSQIERPTRRPTGFIKFDLETDDGPKESVTEVDEPVKERRKSVIFDDTVEELQIQARKSDDESSESELGDGDDNEDIIKQDNQNDNIERTEL